VGQVPLAEAHATDSDAVVMARNIDPPTAMRPTSDGKVIVEFNGYSPMCVLRPGRLSTTTTERATVVVGADGDAAERRL
jgi:hypothetical protein